MLKNKVKKILIETKEKKEKLFISESIIKSRIDILFEGVKNEDDFRKLSKKNQLKLSISFLHEMSYLQTSGLINENTDLGSSLKSMFGGAFNSVAQTMVEPFINKILTSLGIEGFMKNVMTSYLTSNPVEIIKSFSDCKLMTKLVSRSIVEGLVMSLQNKKGYDGMAMNLVRNQLGQMIQSTEFGSKIEDSLSSVICSMMSKFGKNTENVLGKLKGGLSF